MPQKSLKSNKMLKQNISYKNVIVINLHNSQVGFSD